MKKTKYIYLLSQRYSGSTLLSFLLATNPKISTIGERRKFYTHSISPNQKGKMKCSCGELFIDCEYWNAIKNDFLQKEPTYEKSQNFTEFHIFKNKYLNTTAFRLFSFFKLSGFRKIPFKRRIARLNNFNQTLVESILKMDNNDVFLDSSKSINHVIFLEMIKNFDIRIIWLTRDPRAQINSALKYNDYSLKQATQMWKTEMVENKNVLEKLKLPYVPVQYESLCKNPDSEISKILNFIGLDAKNYSLDFRDQQQHIMGNFSMRLGDDRKIELRNEWKEQLTSDQIDTIDEMTKDYEVYKVSRSLSDLPRS